MAFTYSSFTRRFIIFGSVSAIMMAMLLGFLSNVHGAPIGAAEESVLTLQPSKALASVSSSSNLQNIALDKIATKSSSYFGVDDSASLANDGIYDTCSHSQLDQIPFWKVDLQKRYIIEEVTVWNRVECCQERLKDFVVEIYERSELVWSSQPYQGTPPRSTTIDIPSIGGDSVRITIHGRQEYLSLCEVEVFGTVSNNIALHKTATKSSELYDNVDQALLANDGDYDTCSHSKFDEKPFWKVDLQQRYYIDEVRVWNRVDCCQERLRDFVVEIYEKSKLVWSSQSHQGTPSRETTLGIQNIRGDSVMIAIHGRQEYLTLCEVEVFGTVSNVALDKIATESSSYYDVDEWASGANDGNYDTCSHTKLDEKPFWKVDLQQRYIIEDVTVWNRVDCCQERLRGFVIEIYEGTFLAWSSQPYEGTPPSETTVSIPNVRGDTVKIAIHDRQEYLTLCEVEVFGTISNNIALHKTASKSSEWFDNVDQAFLANDGDYNTCSHSKLDEKPFWKVDLQQRYYIEKVTVWNRDDCCQERLRNFVVEIYKGSNLAWSSEPYEGTPQRETTVFIPNIGGDSVKIAVHDRQEYLSLCEVEVFGTVSNVALDNIATKSSSSQSISHPATLANDGDYDSCHHSTLDDKKPFWKVDLQQRYYIEEVRVWNRVDCCQERLQGFVIEIYEESNLVWSSQPYDGIPPRETTLPVPNIGGDSVKITIHGREELLSLCEVEVFGSVLVLGEYLISPSLCLNGNDVTISINGCDYDSFLDGIDQLLAESDIFCPYQYDAQDIMDDLFDNATDAVNGLCATAWNEIPKSSFQDVDGRFNNEFMEEYIEGDTFLNYETGTFQGTQEGNNIDRYRNNEATNTVLEGILSLLTCTNNAIMCCFGRDRQPNDNNGNCEEPIDTNCHQADPADNSNLCWTDSNIPTFSDPFAFPEDSEGPIHCHGLAWMEDRNSFTAQLRFNNLFFVSLFDHMYTRGYVEPMVDSDNIGMCRCIEDMPVVSRADCTQIDATQTFTITYNSNNRNGNGRNYFNVTKAGDMNVEFNECQGIDPTTKNNENNDLGSYVYRLNQEGKFSDTKMEGVFQTLYGYASPNDNQNEEGCVEAYLAKFEEEYPDDIGGYRCPININLSSFRTPNDEPLSLEECQNLCYETQFCEYFSLGVSTSGHDHGVCIGCSSSGSVTPVLIRESGFVSYKMTSTQNIPTSAPTETTYDVVATNKKCPYQSKRRLFRIFDNEQLTRDECYDQCYNTEGCQYFSLWEQTDTDNESRIGLCTGCTSEAVLSDHDGFTTFEMAVFKDFSTMAPTDTPPTCEDEKNYSFNGKGKKYCQKVARQKSKKQKKLCQRRDSVTNELVKASCPKSCGECR